MFRDHVSIIENASVIDADDWVIKPYVYLSAAGAHSGHAALLQPISYAKVIEARGMWSRGVWAASFETPFNSLAGDYVDFAYPADGYVGNNESGKWQSPLQLQAVPMAFHYMNIDPIGPIMSGSTVVHPMISHIQVFPYREFEPVA